jgi:ribose/xylose/arabinose/galactoside ABC-type transport system permease subunit
MSKFLITLGIVLVIVGLAWPWLTKLGLGQLPGDIVIEREGSSFYFPLATSLLISAALTLLYWLIGR